MFKTPKNSNKPAAGNFILMVIGQIISILGSALLRFALSLYILDVTGDETIFAAIYAVSSIPLLLAPLGGAIADRFNRRSLMVIFDFTSSALVMLLFCLMRIGNISVFLIGIIMVLLSVVSALYTPAVTASIPLLVESEKLAGANGIVQAVQALSGVAAPVMGGILYGAAGVEVLVILSGIAFFLSAVMETGINIPFTRRGQTKHIIPTIAGDLKDGFNYVAKVPFILKSMLLAASINLLLTPYFTIGTSIILRNTMGSTDRMYGIGMGVINSATIFGAVSIGVVAKKMRMNTLYRGLLMIALLCLGMALAVTPLMLTRGYYPSFLLFTACAIPIAMAMTIISIFVMAKVQKKTPNENLGKVMAIITATAQCAAPAGQMIYGLLFKVFSSKAYIPTLLTAAAVLLIGILTRRVLRNETT